LTAAHVCATISAFSAYSEDFMSQYDPSTLSPQQQAFIGDFTAQAERIAQQPDMLIREAQVGDLGWLMMAKSEFYLNEFGWGRSFEIVISLLIADYLRNYDEQREHCWIAEFGGQRVGSIMLVHESDDVAKLRLLFVDPRAQGLGLGKRLVYTCMAFAQEAGYKQITLWTREQLAAARSIYAKAGFRLISSEPGEEAGQAVIEEQWVCDLR
jgi:GNAT superfamily N-acetyltransferase